MLRQSLLRSTRLVAPTPTFTFTSASASTSASLRAAAGVARRARTMPLVTSMGRRWYADEAVKKGDEAAATAKVKEAKEEAKGAKEGDKAAEDGEALKKKLEEKECEVIDLKDRYLRQVAEFRNLQDRTAREVKAARDFALQKFAKDLLDSIDNLDRALHIISPEKLAEHKSAAKQATTAGDASSSDDAAISTFNPHLDFISLHEGLGITVDILIKTLAKHGLERFDPAGEKFNPNEHDATFMAPQPDKEEGTVFHVQQKGFKLNGRVLRAAKVGVVKNK